MNSMDKAVAALEDLFGDKSVSIEKTIENLEEIVSRAENYLETLNSELLK